MKIETRMIVAAGADDVWRVIADEYGQVDRWASAVERSEPVSSGDILDGAPMAGRTCQTSLGPFKEEIVRYDKGQFEIAYAATGDKMPFFVKGMVANWKLFEKSAGQTDVQMALTVKLLPVFNILMALPMKIQLGKVVRESLEECKHFVETGTPHPRKKALLKAA